MEELSGIPEKMTAAEFEDTYARAVSRILERNRGAVQDSLEATIRAVVRDEFARMFLGDDK